MCKAKAAQVFESDALGKSERASDGTGEEKGGQRDERGKICKVLSRPHEKETTGSGFSYGKGRGRDERGRVLVERRSAEGKQSGDAYEGEGVPSVEDVRGGGMGGGVGGGGRGGVSGGIDGDQGRCEEGVAAVQRQDACADEMRGSLSPGRADY